MATLLKLDGTTEDITHADPEAYFEQDDIEAILGGPVIAVSSNDGHLLLIREYPEGTEPAPVNTQAAHYFDVWPILGPAVHCFYHEWYADERNRFQYMKPINMTII